MLDIIDISDTTFQNITCILFFLLTSEPDRIDWFFDTWKGKSLIHITEWKLDEEYEWAVHIDLEELDKPGEEAILPFPWVEDGYPTAESGVLAWKHYADTV